MNEKQTSRISECYYIYKKKRQFFMKNNRNENTRQFQNQKQKKQKQKTIALLEKTKKTLRKMKHSNKIT